MARTRPAWEATPRRCGRWPGTGRQPAGQCQRRSDRETMGRGDGRGTIPSGRPSRGRQRGGLCGGRSHFGHGRRGRRGAPPRPDGGGFGTDLETSAAASTGWPLLQAAVCWQRPAAPTASRARFGSGMRSVGRGAAWRGTPTRFWRWPSPRAARPWPPAATMAQSGCGIWTRAARAPCSWGIWGRCRRWPLAPRSGALLRRR